MVILSKYSAKGIPALLKTGWSDNLLNVKCKKYDSRKMELEAGAICNILIRYTLHLNLDVHSLSVLLCSPVQLLCQSDSYRPNNIVFY